MSAKSFAIDLVARLGAKEAARLLDRHKAALPKRFQSYSRIAIAIDLLDQGMSTPGARDVLMQRLGIQRSAAYELLGYARQASGNSTFRRTNSGKNPTIDSTEHAR